MDRDDQAWAVFRCSLLSPLLLEEIPVAEREAYFRMLSEEERLLPNGQRKCISVRTLRRWWKRLSEDGVAGTFRRRRSDRGQPRTRQQQQLQRAVELKREQPCRSYTVIDRILKHEFGHGVPRSTFYRHLRRAQHADLLNRVSCRFQLRPLHKEQTADYIDFQIKQAGGDVKIFSPEVKELLHDFTGGLPRAINNLAIACLLQATARDVVRVDEDIFHQAAGEFQWQ
jgi:hypothetical protein